MSYFIKYNNNKLNSIKQEGPKMNQEFTRNAPGMHQESWYGTRTTRHPPGIRGAVESSAPDISIVCFIYGEKRFPQCPNFSMA
jgi:hypothetical protein